jgi:hypothetical protein
MDSYWLDKVKEYQTLELQKNKEKSTQEEPEWPL